MPVKIIPPPTISVCVLTANRNELLKALLKAIRLQLQPGDELIILDTAGSQATSDIVRGADIPQARYHTFVQPQFNFAEARNHLLSLASREAIAFIDDDAIPLTGWLEQIRQQLTSHEAVGGATLANCGMPSWWDPAINWTVGLSPPGTILGQPGFYPDTCNMAARTSLWREHGFDLVARDDRALYATGREDADWWMQRRLEGRSVIINWRQAVSHHVHKDRLSLRYIRKRARNDGLAAWLRRPSHTAATDIPWDLAHIAAIVIEKTLRRPFNRRDRLTDSIWMHRQWGKFLAVWNAPDALRPSRREQVRQLAKALAFQAKIRAGQLVFNLQKRIRARQSFPPELPRKIFVSADCYLGDSVLLRRHIYSLARMFPNADLLVSCRYPRLFQQLADNVTALPASDASRLIRNKEFKPDVAIVPYFPFGDLRLWRDKLAPVGATFNCDVGFAGRRDYILARTTVAKSMELHEHENLARLFRLWTPPITQTGSDKPPDHPPPLSMTPMEMNTLATTLSDHNVSTPYMAIQVGSGHPSKSWPAEYWIQFLEIFAPAAAFPIVVLGDESWRKAADDIIAALAPVSISMANLCGVPFDQLMPAIAKASYFIGACSGPRHLAMALNVPTFTLYAASEPLRWGASENHHLHGYINALPQKLSGMELQHISEDHRIRLLQPADVAHAALHHWNALQSSL